jgi:hypothetical protein
MLLIGHRIVAWWEQRKKLREMDLALATQFQQLFGEFKEIWRLWKEQRRKPSADYVASKDLLVRACSAEAGLEAILLKLVTDRRLNPMQLTSLGLFRQAFQFFVRALCKADRCFMGLRN